jgi:hypothetical protein
LQSGLLSEYRSFDQLPLFLDELTFLRDGLLRSFTPSHPPQGPTNNYNKTCP